MEIIFKENFKEKLLYMTVEVPEKKYKNQKDIFINASNIKNILYDHYTCKKSYKIGDCLDINLKINNNYKKLCKQIWIFKLIPTKIKTITQKKQLTDAVKK